MNLRIPLLLVSLLCSPLAVADIYKCVDEAGHVTYTNNKPSGKGCNTLARDQAVSSVPGSAPASRPAIVQSPQSGASSGGAGFPRVDSGTQKARDTDRRRILEEELATEQKSLEAARKELEEQESVRYGNERNYQKYLDRVQRLKEDIARTEGNLATIRRELSALK